MQQNQKETPSSISEPQIGKKKQVRKLKFFHGSGMKDGAQVMLCVMATSAAQCLELCDAAGLRGVSKGSIQSHWSTMPTPGAQMAQVMPVTDASVWSVDQHTSTTPIRLYPLKTVRVEERLTRDNLPKNWPFPIAIFSKETS